MAKQPKQLNFEQLLKQSQQLSQALYQTASGLDETPVFLQRDLPQLDEEIKKLAARTERRDQNQRDKARYLLADHKFNMDKYSRSLNSINLKATFEPSEDIAPTNIQAYLTHEHELVVMSVLEETKRDTIHRSEEAFERALNEEWMKMKKFLSEGSSNKKRPTSSLNSSFSQSLVLTPTPSTASAPTPFRNISSNSFGVSTVMQGPTLVQTALQSMDEKSTHFWSKVSELNRKRKRNETFPIVTKFREYVDNKLGMQPDTHLVELRNSFDLLRVMIGEDSVGGEQSPPEEEYAKPRKMETAALKSHFIRGAIHFLEQNYWEYVERTTRQAQLNREAQLGPNPDLQNLIEVYVNLQFKNQTFPLGTEFVGKLPVWAVIFYCMRVGRLLEAQNVLQRAMVAQNSNLKLSCPRAPQYFAEYINNEQHRLSENTWKALLHEFQQLSKNPKTDPWKLLIFNILGKCQPKKSFPDIIRHSEDFFWLKLNLIGPSDESLDPYYKRTEYKLEDLQKTVTDYGSNYFSQNGKKPHQFFRVLIMSQQFEQAVKYLLSVESSYIEAIHFAFALYYYGIIGEPSDPKLRVDSGEVDPSEFHRLIQHYVSTFQDSFPERALDYLACIHRVPTDIQGLNLREKAIMQLVLETQEYARLLGDGVYPGAIEQIEVLGAATSTKVLEHAALQCEEKGKYEDAIHLFKLHKNHSKVYQLLNSQLSRVLTMATPERERLHQLAHEMWKSTRNEMNVVDDRHAKLTFETLFQLMHIYDLWFAERFDEALEHMRNLDILPFSVKPQEMEQKVRTFKDLDPCIKRNFADIMLRTMETIAKKYQELAHQPWINELAHSEKEEKMKGLKEASRALLMFSGMISFRMPHDTQSRLIRFTTYMA